MTISFAIVADVCLGIIAARVVEWAWGFWRDLQAEHEATKQLMARIKLAERKGEMPRGTAATIKNVAAGAFRVVLQNRADEEQKRWAAIGRPRKTWWEENAKAERVPAERL